VNVAKSTSFDTLNIFLCFRIIELNNLLSFFDFNFDFSDVLIFNRLFALIVYSFSISIMFSAT